MSVLENIRPVVSARIASARELHKPTLRSVFRSMAVTALAGYQQWTLPQSNTSQIQILLLHTMFPDEERQFRKLIKSLADEYKFISYSAAVSKLHSGEIHERYLAFSFDDGLKCCLNAASILEEYGASACFFICPDIASETSPSRIEQFCRDRLLHGLVDFLNWDDLARLKNRGHEVGGHTIGHIDLAMTPIEEVRVNLATCRERIVRELGDCEHFAWPYGRFENITSAAINAVFAAGYRSCASGERGANRVLDSAGINDNAVLRRQSIVATWPGSHVRYFLNRG